MCIHTNTQSAGSINRTTKGYAVYANGKRVSRFYNKRKAAQSRLKQMPTVNRDARLPTRLEQDPTRQAGNRKAAKAEIKRRIQGIEDDVIALIDLFPVERVEVNNTYDDKLGIVNRVTYRYLLDADKLLSADEQIRRFINGVLELEAQTGKPQRWFFERYLESAYRKGTAQSAARIESQVSGTGIVPAATERALMLEEILMSEPYRRRSEVLYARAFENMKGFAGQAAGDLARILGDGASAGESPRTIAAKMRRKFKQIEGYRALRISRTEVNKAYTDARLEQTVDARDRLGVDTQVMHISALVPNTRPSHAARHGKTYTPEQQNLWWAQGSNRISCLCSTIEVVFVDGEPLQKNLLERQRQRGKSYFAMNPEKKRG